MPACVLWLRAGYRVGSLCRVLRLIPGCCNLGYRGGSCDLCDQALILRASESRSQRRDGPGGKNTDRQIGPLFCRAISGCICSGSRVLFLLFSSSIASYENNKHINRGEPESTKTAMLFGEFYPNPGNSVPSMVSTAQAASAECVGTFLLVFLIFSLTEGCNIGRPDNSFTPLFIGLTVTIIICIIAPLTQAGLNPARDLSPRLFSYLAGWGKASFPDNNFGLFVYGLSPIFGASLAAMFFTKVVEPIFLAKNDSKPCC